MATSNSSSNTLNQTFYEAQPDNVSETFGLRLSRVLREDCHEETSPLHPRRTEGTCLIEKDLLAAFNEPVPAHQSVTAYSDSLTLPSHFREENYAPPRRVSDAPRKSHLRVIQTVPWTEFEAELFRTIGQVESQALRNSTDFHTDLNTTEPELVEIQPSSGVEIDSIPEKRPEGF